ncbi:MAG TPA: hypothetical protein VJ793_23615 [Anaerolineae bacterium]|nr:hypothetical protein [Anaerolineae bacterium]
MILVIGAKGGVGTTSVAAALARAGDAIGADLADGGLAGRLERPTWALSQLAFALPAALHERVDDIVRRRATLLWTPDCALSTEKTVSVLRDIDNRCPIITDGGIELPPGVEQLAEAVVIVTADDDIARWHERRLLARFPGAIVIEGTREAAADLADRLFGPGD